MKYKVSIRGTSQEEVITASSELEAKYKFCELRKLKYNYLAGKLDIEEIKTPSGTI